MGLITGVGALSRVMAIGTAMFMGKRLNLIHVVKQRCEEVVKVANAAEMMFRHLVVKVREVWRMFWG